MGFMNKKKTEIGFKANNQKAVEEFQTIGSALGSLGHVAGSQAKLAGERAADITKDGIDWAQPRVQKALDELVRLSDEAQAEGRKAVATSQKKGRKALKESKKSAAKGRKQVKDDYLPRVQRALHDATDAAKSGGSLTDRAQGIGKATQKALTEPTKTAKAKKGGKALGWILVGTLAAGAGYLFWRRTQPTEDPWAEEYWDDATTASAPIGTYQEAPVSTDNGAGDATTSQHTGTTPGGPGHDTDEAATDAIVTEQKAEDTQADDGKPGDRKLGEI